MKRAVNLFGYVFFLNSSMFLFMSGHISEKFTLFVFLKHKSSAVKINKAVIRWCK